MIPVIIEDMIKNLTDKRVHFEKRQFYYDSLIKIKKSIEKAIEIYERERNFKS
jgi:hypothetical protein